MANFPANCVKRTRHKTVCLRPLNFTIVKNYRTTDTLRASFNKLTNETFVFDFNDWYNNGYWNDNYIPYSIIIDNEIIANVSVNIMNFNDNGIIRHFIQLGTVMTKPEYRNKGLIRTLMNEIEKDYPYVGGTFLFANDEVLEFYKKFGFTEADEYQYSKNVTITNEASAVKAPMNDKSDWDKVKASIDESTPNGAFELVGNSDLNMFYLASFMKDSVYKVGDSIVVADKDGSELKIHGVFSKEPADLESVINSFGSEVKTVKLCFTPKNTAGYTKILYKEEDCTLFVKGDALMNFSSEGKMFPSLSHA